MDIVRSFIVDNGLSEIAIPDIHQGFSQDVSQAHAQITEEYIKFLYTIWFAHKHIFSVPGPGDHFPWNLQCTRRHC